MTSHESEFHPQHDELVDHLLGEPVAADLDRDCRRDPLLGAERAELRELFSDLRSLATEPSGRVGLSLRYQAMRRQELRQPPAQGLPALRLLRLCAQVAAVALIAVGGMLLRNWLRSEDGSVPGLPAAADIVDLRAVEPVDFEQVPAVRPGIDKLRDPVVSAEQPLDTLAFVDPQRDPEFYSAYRNVLGAEPLRRLDVLALADEDWAQLRMEFRNRFNPQVRSRAMRYVGVRGMLEARVQSLANTVALYLHRELEREEVDHGAVSLALRALVATGSSRRLGAHREEVQLASEQLLAALPDLTVAQRTTALSGLLTLAVIGGRDVAELVGRELRTLTEAVTHGRGEGGAHRPRILNWQSSVAQLADAGQVLRVAAAFGVEARQARQARALLAAHLQERIDGSSDERPDLLAAQLYGFGDLVERDRVERRMLLWRARELAERDWVALLHWSWSRFPSSLGFAAFQRELRQVASLPTPASLRDASAMLLSLAMNYAAPGSASIHQNGYR